MTLSVSVKRRGYQSRHISRIIYMIPGFGDWSACGSAWRVSAGYGGLGWVCFAVSVLGVRRLLIPTMRIHPPQAPIPCRYPPS